MRLFLAGLLDLVAAPAIGASDMIRSDEEVILFPSFAHQSEDGATWRATVHGWIFEPQRSLLAQKLGVRTLQKVFESQAQPNSKAMEIFHRRAVRFFVDNERGKRIRVSIGEHVFELQPSHKDGHFFGEVVIPAGEIRNAKLVVRVQNAGDRKFEGTLTCVPPQGIAVISDIDDTIKISEVRDKKRLLARTFLEEFEAAPGMAQAYRRLASKGAVVFYVSASPWQLFPELDQFGDTEEFPPGEWHMKRIRLKDESIFDLFQDPMLGKRPIIEEILKRFPQRRFLMIGDSGEKDPEIYGDVARTFPDQVESIWIRNVSDENLANDRLNAAFEGVDAARWHLFQDASDIR